MKHRSFHSYTMKQAIEERFILDVLKNSTPVDSYYKLVKKTEDDPEFDTRKAQKKLRRYVESHDHAIRLKAEIMVDHFHDQVLAAGKIGGQARAMVVCTGIERAIQYYHAFKTYLVERKSPYQAIVAFSGEHEYERRESNRGVAKRVSKRRYRRQDPERPIPLPDLCGQVPDWLRRAVVAHDVRGQAAFGHQSGADAVAAQPRAPTKTRLLRARLPEQQRGDHLRLPGLLPHDAAREETDPNKLHDLKAALDDAQVYSPEQVRQVVELFLGGADRDKLDPILDACVAVYVNTLDEDGQVDFKGKAKAFCRTYNFLVVGHSLQQRGVGKAFDPAQSADAEVACAERRGPLEGHPRSHRHGQLPRREEGGDEDRAWRIKDAEIEPVPTDAAATRPEPELDRLSNILKTFNEHFGTLFTDTDRVVKRIRDDIAPKVAADRAYQNAKENTPHTARMAHDQALGKVMQPLLKDDTQVYKQFVENESFKRFVGDMVYMLTSQ